MPVGVEFYTARYYSTPTGSGIRMSAFLCYKYSTPTESLLSPVRGCCARDSSGNPFLSEARKRLKRIGTISNIQSFLSLLYFSPKSIISVIQSFLIQDAYPLRIVYFDLRELWHQNYLEIHVHQSIERINLKYNKVFHNH
jgi:hypothetical protein